MKYQDYKKSIEIINRLERYKDFTLLKHPARFKEMFKDSDFEYISIHSIILCGDDDIVGFCGAFSWIDNEIISIDNDTYDKDMHVFGYREDMVKGKPSLEILVLGW